MDTSAFPTRAVLRWNLAVRVLLAIALPLVAGAMTGGLTTTVLAATMAAALTSFGSLGPDLSVPRWNLVAAVGVPAAIVLGASSARLPSGGLLAVFGLFAIHGAFTRAGMLSQIAWFPVATAGMLAAVLIEPDTSMSSVAVGAAAGGLLGFVLMLVVPLVVRPPRLAVPAEALAVDTGRLRRMVTSPSWVDWAFPLLLGAMSAGLLLLFNVLTDGFKPYWSVLAFVSVLAPTAAETRRSAVETVAATLVGVLLAGVVLVVDISLVAKLGVITLLGVVGALLLIRQGFAAKALTTPLAVVVAAVALDGDGLIALPIRLGEYLIGALLGVIVMVVTERLGRRLSEDTDEDEALVG